MPIPVPTPRGAITDVPGLLVGHFQRRGRGWQTGTTAIIVPRGATPGVDVRGGAPGTRETDAIGPSKLVQSIHGICLTGGSAFGLRAADGVMDWLAEQGLGYPVGTPPTGDPVPVVPVVPVVPAAVIFDLGRGGVYRNHPDRGFGLRAARAASDCVRRWGSVGAGTGARAGGLQGGVGTASTVVRLPDVSAPDSPVDVVVGALAVVNSNGSPIDPSTGLPWEAAGWGLRRPTAAEGTSLAAAREPAPAPTNTTLGVVATSAALTKVEASTLAAIAHDGLARAIRPAHSLVDGDITFALATGLHELPLAVNVAGTELDGAKARVNVLNLLLHAAAETFAAACTHAILSATRVGELPAYRDLCPPAR